MLEVALADINTLPYPAVSPTDNPILNQLLVEIQELRSEVTQLREEREKDRQEIQDLKEQREKDRAEFECFKQTHKTFAIQTTNDIDRLFEVAEEKPASSLTSEPTQKTQDHINGIAAYLGAMEKRYEQGPVQYLRRLRREGLKFSQLANVMHLTTERIRQLAKLAAGDPRFNIQWSPSRKNAKVFKLRRWDDPTFL